MTKTKHWAEQYRNAPSNTLEGKIWLTACYTSGRSEEQIRAIAELAFNNVWCIWHATFIYSGSKGQCPCADCART